MYSGEHRVLRVQRMFCPNILSNNRLNICLGVLVCECVARILGLIRDLSSVGGEQQHNKQSHLGECLGIVLKLGTHMSEHWIFIKATIHGINTPPTRCVYLITQWIYVDTREYCGSRLKEVKYEYFITQVPMKKKDLQEHKFDKHLK